MVLIETGPWSLEDPERPLVRLNFVALVTALDALATGRVRAADPARYDGLPTNGSQLFTLRISHATIDPGTGVAPFLGDVGVGATRTVRAVDGRRELSYPGRIDDLGDLRTSGALEDVDASGLTLLPALGDAVQRGDTIVRPDWAASPASTTIEVGRPAHLLLARPAGTPDRFVVERVIGGPVPPAVR